MRGPRGVVAGIIGVALFVLIPIVGNAAGMSDEGTVANVVWVVQMLIGIAGLVALVFGAVTWARRRSGA